MDGRRDFPEPATVDVLAEVSRFRTGKRLEGKRATLKSLCASVLATSKRHPEHRDALISLAAHCVARIERIDREAK